MVEIEFYQETQTISTTTGVSMAARKTLMEGYLPQDLFDLQDQLDAGTVDYANVGTKTWGAKSSMLGMTTASAGGTGALLADKNTLGSLLGMTNEIAAYKKRKQEQQKMKQAGFGSQQSILGGGAF